MNRFDTEERVHELPTIFHYWSNKYLRPKLERFGFASPDDFFFRMCLRILDEQKDREVVRQLISLGAGNGELEIPLARFLMDHTQQPFLITITDINENMLARAKTAACGAEVESCVRFEVVDFNRWQPDQPYDVVIANQCLHHVTELEDLFQQISSHLAEDGYFLVSDMIGRNGHQRWPEALALVQQFWQELPEAYRWNHQLRRHEQQFINHDCSDESFEGIRSQDILPLLIENFNFELFIAFANVIDIFVDRAFGHNFDSNAQKDLEFIDRIHRADEVALTDGTIKPTHMIAAMTTENRAQLRYIEPLTPEFAVRR